MATFGGLEWVTPEDLGLAVGLDLDEWQLEIMTTDDDSLVNVNRQAGKSTVSALRMYSQACYYPGMTGVLISPSLRQSGEIFRKVMDFHRKLELVPKVKGNMHELELLNSSRILSLPGAEDTVRGVSAVDLIIIDEASRVDDPIYIAVAPMVATCNGTILAPSTPNGQRGWWYNAWSSGSENWKRIHVTADNCPRIPKKFLESQRKEFGEHAYLQEYFGEFLANTDALFRPEDIAEAFAGNTKALNLDEGQAPGPMVSTDWEALDLG